MTITRSSFHLINSLLNYSSKVLDDWEEVDNLGENNQTVPDLNKVLALQTDHQRLGDLIMPLVTHVPGHKENINGTQCNILTNL